MRLTTNQLILLLAAHRGTLDNELHVGTRFGDLKVLGRLGLVVRKVGSNGSTYDTTGRGDHLAGILQVTTERYLAGDRSLNRHQLVEQFAAQRAAQPDLSTMTLAIDASDVRQALSPVLSALAHAHHGSFEPERGDAGLSLSDMDGDKARVSGGTAFFVAGSEVDVTREGEGDDAGIKGLKLSSFDPTVHGSEELATEVAVARAKSEPGSRHLVLKAVAMHEVAVPIKSTRL